MAMIYNFSKINLTCHVGNFSDENFEKNYFPKNHVLTSKVSFFGNFDNVPQRLVS